MEIESQSKNNTIEIQTDSKSLDLETPKDGDKPFFKTAEVTVKDEDHIKTKVQTGWSPSTLRPWAILTFIGAFIVIFFSLMGLYVVSKRQSGLSTADERKHYLWTYGPTAVFLILTAFWRHLDFQVKQMIPWLELANGPKQAKFTIMLDYISPFQPIAFWKAIKNKHWLVVVSGVGFAILKLCAIFATGLFILQNTTMIGENSNFRYLDQFSAKRFNLSNLDSRTGYAVYGVNTLNLTYPAGTTRDAAFQSLKYTDTKIPENIFAVSVPVDRFSAELECEEASISWFNSRRQSAMTATSSYYNVTAKTPTCTIFNAALDAPDWMGNYSFAGYNGIIQSGNCAEIEDIEERFRVLVMLGYSTRPAWPWVNTLEAYSAVVCKPRYRVEKTQISTSSNDIGDYTTISKEDSLGASYTFPEITPRQLYNITEFSLSLAISVGISDANYSFDPFFNLLRVGLPADQNITNLMDPAILGPASSKNFGTITAQIAKQYFTVSTSNDFVVPASVMYLQQRLIIRPASFAVMEAFVLILMLIAFALFYMIPRYGVAPRDPSSIGAVATILSRSSTVEKCLAGTSNLDADELEKRFSKYRFFSVVEKNEDGKTFRVEAVDIDSPQEDKSTVIYGPDDTERPHQSRKHWWKPLGFRPYIIAPLLLLSLAIIVVLEVLYRKSEKDHGLAYIPIGGYIHYTWVYLPAIVMVLITTLFNVVDYATRCIAPYQAMRTETTLASRGILYNPTGKLAILAFWHAVRERHLTVIATTFAVLLAPILTITVSGLFTSELVSDIGTLTIQQMDWFVNETTSQNASWTLVSGLVLEGNLSYPTWTYEEFTFPEFEVLSPNANIADISSISVEVPALRANMNCSVVPPNQYSAVFVGGIMTTEVDPSSPNPQLNVNISTKDGCGNYGEAGISDLSFFEFFDIPEKGYFGAVKDFGWTNLDCPSVAFYYGFMEGEGKIGKLTTLFCKLYTEELRVQTQFFLPNFTVDSTIPPQPIEGTSKYFSASFQNRSVQNTLAEFKVNDTTNMFDNFFTAAVYGVKGTPAEELTSDDVLADAVKRVYGVMSSQAMSENHRQPLNQTVSVTGSSHIMPRPRLVQTEISTRVLQGLLAIIIITTIIAWFGVRSQKVLPRESNSFATIGSYLAGSDVLRLIPPGAEWSDSEEKIKGTLFSEHLYGFGWWSHGEEEAISEKRYGVGVGKPHEK